MPVYGYRCEKCGDEFEVLQRVGDDPVAQHDACGGRVHRVFFPVGVIFKGSGFYSTDYRGKKPGAAKPDAKGETKSDGQPAESKSGGAASTDSGAGGGKESGTAAAPAD